MVATVILEFLGILDFGIRNLLIAYTIQRDKA